MSEIPQPQPLKTVPLDALHRSLGARMVPFAGYSMPVQYPAGILAEHTATRTACTLFDVSHMGQAKVHGVGSGGGAAEGLERLTPGSLMELKVGRQRYTLLTNDQGGILDDLMVANLGNDTLFLVVNAARKDHDFAHIRAHLNGQARLEVLEDRALLALQGPGADGIMAHFAPASPSLVFMDVGPITVGGVPCIVSRSGYTGEDGFELSVPAAQADLVARHFLELPGVTPAGLGARDSLRLEAGLPLYGSDIDETTTPVEAALSFAIGKRRRAEGGFPGAETILRQLETGTPRQRVGILLEGRAPARPGTEILSLEGEPLGTVTSGTFGPSVGAAIAMGYVSSPFAAPGTPLSLMVRGKALLGHVVTLPFIDHRYARG